MSQMYIEHHLIHEGDGTALRFLPSPHQSEGLEPLYLIVHYTASLTLRSTVGWFLDPRAKASAHVIVDRNGEAVQMVSLDLRAWHTGRSRWDVLDDLNAHSIGIELVNAGALDQSAAGEGVGHVIPGEQVVVARHRHESTTRGWQTFTEIQIARVLHIAPALHRKYQFRDVLGPRRSRSIHGRRRAIRVWLGAGRRKTQASSLRAA